MALTREERARLAAQVVLAALEDAPAGLPRARLETVALGLQRFADQECAALREERDSLREQLRVCEESMEFVGEEDTKS